MKENDKTLRDGNLNMAQHKSAKKRIRQTLVREGINKARRSRIRTFIKRVDTAIESGVAANADAALINVQRELARGVTRGVLKATTAARKTSRLSARVKAFKQAA